MLERPQDSPTTSTEQKPEVQRSYWVIFNGPMKGIYDDWSKVQIHVTGTPYGHKKYPSLTEAKQALKDAEAATTMAQYLQNITQTPQNK
ncbi:hypothetical protein PIB30_043538, partial [Stylosanthes scabra]|nr:hypothetical protein [Stylosanthes scabra]